MNSPAVSAGGGNVEAKVTYVAEIGDGRGGRGGARLDGVGLVRVGRLLRDVVPARAHVGGRGRAGGGRAAARAHGAQVAPDVVLVRRQLRRARQAALRRRQLAALHAHHAQVVQRLHVVRLQLQDAPVALKSYTGL